MTKIWLIALLLSVLRLCSAQGNELVVASSLNANSLSGAVVAPDSDPIPRVTVSRIECGKGEFRGVISPVVLQQTQTDANGTFTLPWKDHNRTCLQAIAPGFNILQVEVKYARNGGKLKLILYVGT
jgi:hypothetical protein